MTALNLIVQQRAQSAYLLTDTACYSFGTVVGFTNKVIALDFGPEGSAAMAVSGIAHNEHFLSRISPAPQSLSSFLAELPDIFRDVERALEAAGKPAKVGTRNITVALAVFDRHQARASGYAISNNTISLPRTYGPYKLHRLPKPLLTPCEHDPIPVGTDISDPRQWDVEQEAGPLIEAQRAEPFPGRDESYIGIGGQAILTRISAAGIEQRLIRTWPDRIGSRIKLAPNNQLDLADQLMVRIRSRKMPPLSHIRMTVQRRGPTRPTLADRLSRAIWGWC